MIQEFRREEITNLRTLYIGGGTPTALTADQLEYLLKELTKSLDLSQMEELTIEANPGDLDPDKIAVLKNSPVNRVSLGVQTFDNRLLKKIGRSHQEQDIYDNIERLKLAGLIIFRSTSSMRFRRKPWSRSRKMSLRLLPSTFLI